ncbi:MAG: GGDEF domain-containing protein [Gammaproteobacteria bacterium]|nr:GGDEF domain-containing protein [Gammaproteobacteria bacterium]
MRLTVKLAEYCYRLSARTIIVIGLVFSALIGLIDSGLGNEISLTLFYLVPIAFVAWFAGRDVGALIAVPSALVWYASDKTVDMIKNHWFESYGDFGSKLTFFLIVAFLVARQRLLLDRERAASRTDFLTGALNRRALYEIASAEIQRAKRHARPFTITYFDVDDFKAINDSFGHAVGDEVLCHIVEIARQNLRATDSIARLGGDEFAFLLPETDSDAARAVVDKIRRLTQEDMDAQSWPVTLSIGVLTCAEAPDSVGAMLRVADQLMYQVKLQGKNAILYATCSDALAIAYPPDNSALHIKTGEPPGDATARMV